METVEVEHGAIFELRNPLPFGHIQESWRQGRFYEQQMLEHISLRYSGGSFVDIGASVGNHTVFFGLRCAPDMVYSFEPVPGSFDHLERNVVLNNLGSKTCLYDSAVGDEICSGTMSLPVSGNEGMYVFQKSLEGLFVMFPLDWFKLLNVTLIKIDAENCETAILQGALETIERYKPVIFIEAQTFGDLEAIKALLSPLGYTPEFRFNATPTYEFVCGGK